MASRKRPSPRSQRQRVVAMTVLEAKQELRDALRAMRQLDRLLKARKRGELVLTQEVRKLVRDANQHLDRWGAWSVVVR